MTLDQQVRLAYLRGELSVWETRRSRARWSIAADRLYNSSAMDHEMSRMSQELRSLEELVERPRGSGGTRRAR